MCGTSGQEIWISARPDFKQPYVVNVCAFVHLDACQHAGGGHTEVQVGQCVGVGRFVQQRRFFLWQVV